MSDGDDGGPEPAEEDMEDDSIHAFEGHAGAALLPLCTATLWPVSIYVASSASVDMWCCS